MQLILNIENKSVAKKILWLLEHFKKEGLKIEQISDHDDKAEFSEKYIKENWRTIVSEGLKELDDTYYKSEQYKIDRAEHRAEKYK